MEQDLCAWARLFVQEREQRQAVVLEHVQRPELVFAL